jgi:hypothetical protein
MWTSGNGRYGLVLSILIGPMIAAGASRIFGKRRHALLFLAVLISLQAMHLQQGRYRWLTGHWTANWYDEIVPDKLKQEPYLYISIGRQSHSFVAPFLSQQSAFMNPVGQMSVDIEGPGGDRLAALLKNYDGKVRVLSRILIEEMAHESPSDLWVAEIDAYLTRLNMVVDSGQCLMIKTDGQLDAPGGDAIAGRETFDRPPYRLITCALKPVSPDDVLASERRRMKAVVGKVIAWCPQMFKPSYYVVEHRTNGWDAVFEDSDARVTIRGSATFVRQKESYSVTPIGKVSDWESGAHMQDCTTLLRASKNRVDDWIAHE